MKNAIDWMEYYFLGTGLSESTAKYLAFCKENILDKGFFNKIMERNFVEEADQRFLKRTASVFSATSLALYAATNNDAFLKAFSLVEAYRAGYCLCKSQRASAQTRKVIVGLIDKIEEGEVFREKYSDSLEMEKARGIKHTAEDRKETMELMLSGTKMKSTAIDMIRDYESRMIYGKEAAEKMFRGNVGEQHRPEN